MKTKLEIPPFIQSVKRHPWRRWVYLWRPCRWMRWVQIRAYLLKARFCSSQAKWIRWWNSRYCTPWTSQTDCWTGGAGIPSICLWQEFSLPHWKRIADESSPPGGPSPGAWRRRGAPLYALVRGIHWGRSPRNRSRRCTDALSGEHAVTAACHPLSGHYPHSGRTNLRYTASLCSLSSRFVCSSVFDPSTTFRSLFLIFQ